MKITHTCTTQPKDSIVAAVKFALRHTKKEWKDYKPAQVTMTTKDYRLPTYWSGLACWPRYMKREGKQRGIHIYITLGAGELESWRSFKLNNNFEVILFLVAHEIQHTVDMQHGKKPTETAANSWARHIVAQWRHETINIGGIETEPME